MVDGFRVRFKPSERELAEAVSFGYQFGLKLLKGEEKKKPSARGTLVKCLVCGEIFDSSIETCPVCGVGAENFVPVASQDTDFCRDTEERFVILGGGTAALQAAKAIRLRNRTAEITMLSEEKELPYDRPMLTKNLFGAVSGGAIASVSANGIKKIALTCSWKAGLQLWMRRKKRLSSQTARFIPSISASMHSARIALCRPSRAMICRR